MFESEYKDVTRLIQVILMYACGFISCKSYCDTLVSLILHVNGVLEFCLLRLYPLFPGLDGKLEVAFTLSAKEQTMHHGGI